MYDAHIRRQAAELRVFMEDEGLTLDPSLDYHSIWGLSSEVKERLALVRPTSVVSLLFFHKYLPHGLFSPRVPRKGWKA